MLPLEYHTAMMSVETKHRIVKRAVEYKVWMQRFRHLAELMEHFFVPPDATSAPSAIELTAQTPSLASPFAPAVSLATSAASSAAAAAAATAAAAAEDAATGSDAGYTRLPALSVFPTFSKQGTQLPLW